jgi:hypothetical protein
MPNFKTHARVGIIVSLVVGTLLLLSVPYMPLTYSAGLAILSCFFFSLYPDLDIASVPQRWFFRIMLVLSLVLFYKGMFEILSIILMVSIIPLVHKHRGFTHWISTSITLPIALCFLIESRVVGPVIDGKSFIEKYFVYIIASMIGWWTHLILDRRG